MNIKGIEMIFRGLPVTDEPCWWCGEALTSPAKIRSCRSCSDANGGLSAAEAEFMLQADNKNAAWLGIQMNRGVGTKNERRPTPGAPERFAYAEAEGEVLAWACHPRPCLLVLLGPTGTGKTWQAWGAVRVLSRRQSAQGIKAASLSRIDRDGFNEMLATPVLLIDDLAARTSAGAIATALELLDHRLDHQRLTIVTTNAGFNEISALEPRIASRLASGLAVRMSGVDRRLPVRVPA